MQAFSFTIVDLHQDSLGVLCVFPNKREHFQTELLEVCDATLKRYKVKLKVSSFSFRKLNYRVPTRLVGSWSVQPQF